MESPTRVSALETVSAETLLKIVGDLLEKKSDPLPSENTSFQCLRAFSGNIPAPTGEKTLDTGLKQAPLIVDECECPKGEKQKPIRVLKAQL